MDSASQTGSASLDHLPDSQATAVRKARQHLVASQGMVRMVLGSAFFVAFAVVRAATDYKSEAHMQSVCLLVVAFIALEILLPPVVSRLRRQRGLMTVGRAEGQIVRFFGHPGWLLLLGFLALVAIGVLAAAMFGIEARGISAARVDSFDTLAALGGAGVLASLYALRWRQVRLWEDLLMAGGVLVAGLFAALLRDRMRLEVMVMVLCVAAFASGLALHFRWREYTRPEGSEETQ